MGRKDKSAEDRWRRKLARELAREQLRRARVAVRDARAAKRQARSRADQACRDARAQLKEWAAAERERVRAEVLRLRAALKQSLTERRERVRECCGPDRARARAEANERISATRQALADILEARQRERIYAGRDTRQSSRPEQRQESDSEVAANLSPEQLVVWEKVKGRIKAGRRSSRTEAFLHWVHDHSADVARIHAAEAERQYQAAVRDEARQRKALAHPPQGGAKLQAHVAEQLEQLGVTPPVVTDEDGSVSGFAYHESVSNAQAAAAARMDDEQLRAELARVLGAEAPRSIAAVREARRFLENARGERGPDPLASHRERLQTAHTPPDARHIGPAHERSVKRRGKARTRARGPEPLDLEAFALRVRQLGYFHPSVKRFHEDRAYLGSIYDVGAPWAEDLDAWKARVVEAHRKGLLRITRADLVGAMPQYLVQRSEATYLGSTFHFLALDPVPF